jgi:hypothetical protein
MNKYKNLTLILIVFLMVFCVISVANAHALPAHPLQTLADSAGKGDACNGLSQVGGSCGSGQASLTKVLSGIVGVISYIAGIIAIIMIVISGIRYMTSGGDSNSVSGAKTALIYALIGIFVAALAQVLVHFVLNQASGV